MGVVHPRSHFGSSFRYVVDSTGVAVHVGPIVISKDGNHYGREIFEAIRGE